MYLLPRAVRRNETARQWSIVTKEPIIMAFKTCADRRRTLAGP